MPNIYLVESSDSGLVNPKATVNGAMTKLFVVLLFGCLVQLGKQEILPANEKSGSGRGSMRREWFDTYKSGLTLRSVDALTESSNDEARQGKLDWLQKLAEWLDKDAEEWTQEDDKWVEDIMKWFEELAEEDLNDEEENGSWENDDDDDDDVSWDLEDGDEDYDDDDDDWWSNESDFWNLTSSEERELDKYELIYEWLISLGYDMKDGKPQKRFTSA